MLRVPLTKEIIRIAMVGRPQTAYEISEVLCTSYNRVLHALKRYSITLPEGDLPWRKENDAANRIEELVFKGNTLEFIAHELNTNITPIYRYITSNNLHAQWRRARAEKILNLLEN